MSTQRAGGRTKKPAPSPIASPEPRLSPAAASAGGPAATAAEAARAAEGVAWPAAHGVARPIEHRADAAVKAAPAERASREGAGRPHPVVPIPVAVMVPAEPTQH